MNSTNFQNFFSPNLRLALKPQEIVSYANFQQENSNYTQIEFALLEILRKSFVGWSSVLGFIDNCFSQLSLKFIRMRAFLSLKVIRIWIFVDNKLLISSFEVFFLLTMATSSTLNASKGDAEESFCYDDDMENYSNFVDDLCQILGFEAMRLVSITDRVSYDFMQFCSEGSIAGTEFAC